jgi:hypothetical protein
VIPRLYARYVDLLAADRGALAFVKWFFAGLLLQIVVLLPALPLLAAAIMVGGDAGRYLSSAAFLAAFAAARVFLFAVPCARVAERKLLPWPPAWGAGGLLFGQWVLGLAAALPPNPPRGAGNP